MANNKSTRATPISGGIHMKIARSFILILATLAPVLLPATVPDDVMPLDQVKRGMTGIGKTVFEGTKIEEFNVEVIDVLPNAMPKQDIIIVKLSGHGLEDSGVVAGMSGSPVYINGKIIGAVAYAWSFSKKPIAGVTPIENMLKDLQHPVEQRRPGGRIVGNNTIKTASGEMAPVMSPLMVSGLAPSLMDELEEELAPFYLKPMRAGGGHALEPSPELVPGAAVGVTLTRGDIQMDGIGTVTYRLGDKVVAFGHPFMGGGQWSLPMTGAYVHTILPSLAISTKMASSLSEVGTLSQDRQSGICGQMGKKAAMIPVEVKVSNPNTGFSDTYHVEMGWDASFTPKALDVVIKSALMSAEPLLGENTVTARMNIVFAGYKPLSLNNTFYNNMGPYNKAMVDIVQKLILNPFEEVRLESLKFDLSVDHHIRLATIKGMWMEEDSVRPGGTAHLHVTLKPFEGEDMDYPVEIEAPQDLNSGDKFLVGVAGGREVMPQTPPPANFADVMEQFASLYQWTDMVVIQQMPTVGAVTEGFFLSELPPSAIRIMGPLNSTGSSLRQDLKFIPIHTKWVVSGKARLVIQVR